MAESTDVLRWELDDTGIWHRGGRDMEYPADPPVHARLPDARGIVICVDCYLTWRRDARPYEALGRLAERMLRDRLAELESQGVTGPVVDELRSALALLDSSNPAGERGGKRE